MQPELINRRELSELFGGLHASTIYRLISKGIIPKPIHVGGSSRWLRQECEAALARLTEART
jgi:predicted DNA-binding transcriptional regulator AlpA